MGRKSKPYATMKDGPDKYLFRKDGKQKLVGSADNSPEDGEEELEESGYRYERDEEMELDGNNSKIWHYLITPDGERFTLDHSPYQEMSPEEFDKHVEEFRRGSLKENDMTDELNELRKAAGLPIVEDCDESENAEKNDDGDCSPFTHADENVKMVREEEQCSECDGVGEVWGKACEKCGGEAALEEGDVDEDFLAPPKDSEDTYDTGEGRIEPELDRQTDYNAPPRDDGDDSYDMFDDSPIDEAQYTRKDFRMVADTLLKIEDPIIRKAQAEEYAAKFAAANPLFSEELFMQAAGIDAYFQEQGPGDDEFAHDDDAMVDIGDEDYDTGEDLSDFGGEYYGDSQYYETIEMNELRKAAGLEQVNEADRKGFVDLSGSWWESDPKDIMGQIYWLKGQLPPSRPSAFARNWNKVVKNLSKKSPPPEGWVNPVETPEPEEQTCPACQGRGHNYEKDDLCYRCDGEGTIIETIEMTESEPHNTGDYDFIDFKDETGYYLVADELGDRIIFGMNNEVGIPEQYTDKVIGLLRGQGLEKGIDYDFTSFANQSIGGEQVEEEGELQNGYNDKKYVDGEDFFPKGSHQSPSDDLGPTASGYGDNAMQNRMRSKEADAVYEGMKQKYRRFRKS